MRPVGAGGGRPRSAERTRPDVLVMSGGIARLPFGEDHGIIGFPLPPGQVYGCMGETMLLGLEGVRDATFTGMLPAENVFRLEAMAKRHGFALAEYKLAADHGRGRRATRPLSTDRCRRMIQGGLP